ncbi:MAG: methyltransferase domain-containing protein [Oscillospiraceae bacterium]|nr:methyltransferase domain-containing protein [Oscillospiraceae bacterium]
MDEVKTRISSYWSQRAEQFSALRVKEYESDKHMLWMAEFKKYIPSDRSLDILDVGTGTGFFAMLLSQEGHCVTGIDLCPDMIEQARKTAVSLGIHANFHIMDAEHPLLRPASYDAIVTRNLTWTLPHLDSAYRAWHTLLKPGGVLVNFDADYCREDNSQPLPANHAHKNISSALVQEYESIKDTLRPSQKPRPEWDMELLAEAGFHDIRVDRSVWKRIYSDFDEFYNPTPIFTISAKA